MLDHPNCRATTPVQRKGGIFVLIRLDQWYLIGEQRRPLVLQTVMNSGSGGNAHLQERLQEEALTWQSGLPKVVGGLSSCPD
jgi:hypothetical protein